ncbi:SDR family NAD(P)-dependent oxidoreductase [Actinoplanes siamensis]|uniref:Short-chain dehydrogenase n=1 Tax=Actinoplanes siamensis TaxID=1223317 RepID=A0A919NA34_9ACTN|nr:SDR family NAD(P)-dependent oxidoreductase [Actinoplanes siamensis]GIF07082.1 short-chain dehydrogenase [Actinoplanes siamensis]
MDLGVSGKRVLLTGGSKGIGRATVLAFADGGARVLTCYHSSDQAAKDLQAELDARGPGHRVVAADVTTRAGADQLAQAAEETFGGLDVLVNNVGVDGNVPFDQLRDEEWDRVVGHNVTTAYLVTSAVLPLVADGGSVVNIGSSVALRGRSNGVHYTTSKAALIGFTRALCKEVGPRGIRVNTVAPALTETEPGAGLPPQAVSRIVGMTALGRICQPEDVAAAVLFLAGDASRYITGTTLPVDGGI